MSKKRLLQTTFVIAGLVYSEIYLWAVINHWQIDTFWQINATTILLLFWIGLPAWVYIIEEQVNE